MNCFNLLIPFLSINICNWNWRNSSEFITCPDSYVERRCTIWKIKSGLVGTSLHQLEQFCDLNYSNTTTGLQFFMVQLYLNSSNLPQMVLWGLFKISDKSWSQILSSLVSGLSAGQATTQAFWLQNGVVVGQEAGSHFSWSVSLAISVLSSDFSVNLTDSPDSDMSDESSCNNHHREAGIIVYNLSEASQSIS